ncbi:hypothetical protein AVEN_41809-1 [Araneus ventricosus]|uniref:Uncharacterized protein n=1 Tax=Araneus ventricosus TaxID=182803 RepID=A0A4Y2ACA3_ARAVE|nr:hypothetical protein AVEN_41809-1 [Araneus ventricosus]
MVSMLVVSEEDIDSMIAVLSRRKGEEGEERCSLLDTYQRASCHSDSLFLTGQVLPLSNIPNFVFKNLENKTEALMPVAANRINAEIVIKSIYNM